MTPDWRLLADSVDVTARLRDRLIRLTVTDEAGLESDALEIELDNRDGAIAVPRAGAALSLSLGWRGRGLHPMGLFVVDEIRSTSPPRTMTVAAKAADVRASYKAPRTKSWHDTTLGHIVTEIAGRHGLAPAVAAELAAVRIMHLDQTAESDMALLTRLARQYDAVAKPTNGRLVFAPRGTATSVGGRPLPSVTMSLADGLSSWSATLSDRGRHGSVTAHWHDAGAADRRRVTVGDGDPPLVLPHAYPSEVEARAAATAKLQALSRGTAKLSLSCPGRPELAAETRLTLTGLDEAADGVWTVTKVEHTLSAAGLVTRVEGEGVT